MKITYVARKVNLRDNFKERVEQKLKKFSKIFSDNAEATVVVTLEKNRQIVFYLLNMKCDWAVKLIFMMKG